MEEKISFTGASTGTRVRYLRFKQNISQSTLAEQLDIPILLLDDYESGKKEMPHGLVDQISKIFGTSTGFILCQDSAI